MSLYFNYNMITRTFKETAMNQGELTFNKFFKELRTKKGISLRGFCKNASADPANISRMERGLSVPPKSGKILERYADALELGKGSEDRIAFFDLAMASSGKIPGDILADSELYSSLPLFFSDLRKKKMKFRTYRSLRKFRISELSSAYSVSGKPTCYIIAGSNGSGKTTFAREFLPKYAGCTYFINPDLIASGLSPFRPENASIASGRIVLQQIYENSFSGRSFSIETTLSGKTYFKIFSDLKAKGYQIQMFYLWIPNPDLAIQRIHQRVEAGGHNVPSKDVLRRFDRTLSNLFNIYLPVIDILRFFDNSEETPSLVFEEINRKRNILNHEKYRQITGD